MDTTTDTTTDDATNSTTNDATNSTTNGAMSNGQMAAMLAERIARTAAMLDAGTHRLLTDIRQFDAAQLWSIQGCMSCAHWLNWRCGIAFGAAREKIRVAHALAALPLIDEAMRLG